VVLLWPHLWPHFRSDYTIVHIPDGNFRAVREAALHQLNLLRMGCSGRSASPSEEPGTRHILDHHTPIYPLQRNHKDRFISTTTTENTNHTAHLSLSRLLPYPSPHKRHVPISQSNYTKAMSQFRCPRKLKTNAGPCAPCNSNL